MALLRRLLHQPPTITPATAAAGVADGSLLLVDVREPSETATGYARGARRIPLGQLAGSLDELAAAGTPVAFVCQSGTRSARAASAAGRAGIDARNVQGGMRAWSQAGLPVRRPR